MDDNYQNVTFMIQANSDCDSFQKLDPLCSASSCQCYDSPYDILLTIRTPLEHNQYDITQQQHGLLTHTKDIEVDFARMDFLGRRCQ